MKSLGALSKMTVVAKSQVSGGYFYESGKDIINDLPKDPGCVIVMLGATNPSKTGISEMTSLLDKLRIKYKSKQIYVVQELPVSVEYDKVSTSYESINKEIQEFNNAIFTYSQGIDHITIINGSEDNCRKKEHDKREKELKDKEEMLTTKQQELTAKEDELTLKNNELKEKEDKLEKEQELFIVEQELFNKRIYDLVRSMLKENMDIDTIKKVTSLKEEEIKNLL